MLDFDTITTGDLELDARGELVLTRGVDTVRQRVQARLATARGEWAYDVTLGLPLFEIFHIKNPDLNRIRAAIVQAVSSTPQVEQARVRRLEVIDRRLVFDVVFRVVLEDDEQVDVVESFALDDDGELTLLLESIGAIV